MVGRFKSSRNHNLDSQLPDFYFVYQNPIFFLLMTLAIALVLFLFSDIFVALVLRIFEMPVRPNSKHTYKLQRLIKNANKTKTLSRTKDYASPFPCV